MYYQPDITWQSFNCNTQEEYVKSYVVKGNFHTAVHKDVLKSLEKRKLIPKLSDEFISKWGIL